RTFRGHTRVYRFKRPEAEVSAALDRVMSEEIVLRLGNKFRTFRGHTRVYRFKRPEAEVSAALDRVMSEEIVL
ncbi:hypothetical protein CKJ89_38905, partial [Klebsiella pneumoniae]